MAGLMVQACERCWRRKQKVYNLSHATTLFGLTAFSSARGSSLAHNAVQLQRHARKDDSVIQLNRPARAA